MAYCLISDVNDKSISDIITSANWQNADIQKCIDEGSDIIDAYLIKVGYQKIDLSNAPLIKQINILLAKYNILRNIYANINPSKVEQRGFIEWRNKAIELLEKLQDGNIVLTDNDGKIVSKRDLRYTPIITTENTKRIFKIAKEYEWSEPDSTYNDEDVIGEK